MSPVRPNVRVIGRRMEPSDYLLRDFLTRTAQPCEWLEAGSAAADELLAARALAGAELPVVVEDGGAITGATARKLADAWSVHRTPDRGHYDVVIVGAGPAGLGAAVYAASDGLATLVVDRDIPGGQASHTSLIENFFGFPGGIGGAELTRLAGRQAEGFGAELLLMGGVTDSRWEAGGPFELDLAGGYTVTASVAIAAPGMAWRRLDVDGIEELLGRGVYYGAGRSEATQCGGEPVVVVGAGNSAGQAVMNLGSAGARVTMAVRGESLGKSMSGYLVERIEAHPLIDVRLRTRVVGVDSADGRLSGVLLEDGDGRGETVAARALFLCLGGAPQTAWCAGCGVTVDRAGFILTGPDLVLADGRPEAWPLQRDPLAVETSIPGLFAAGDVRSGSTKRVAGAVGDGAMAVALAHLRLDEIARAGS